MYFNENCAQLVQSNSAAHSGTGCPSSRPKYAPFMNGRLISTASPWSAASGSNLSSARRSVME